MIGRVEATGDGRVSTLPSGEPFDAWIGAVLDAAADAILLEVSRTEGVDEILGGAALSAPGRRNGVLLTGAAVGEVPVDALRAWSDSGATVVGIAEEATPGRVARLAGRIADVEGARRSAREAMAARWDAWLASAARRAPGGAALLVADPAHPIDPRAALPAGFEWTIASPDDVTRLPEARFRLVAVSRAMADLGQVARAVETGGILVAHVTRGVGAVVGALRIVELATDAGGDLVIARRDP